MQLSCKREDYTKNQRGLYITVDVLKEMQSLSHACYKSITHSGRRGEAGGGGPALTNLWG